MFYISNIRKGRYGSSLLFFLLTGLFISVAYARLQVHELRNFTLCVEFNDTLLSAQQRAEILRGIKMGMNMWESVLPDLHIMYGDSSVPGDSVKKFRIGNYKNDRGVAPPGTAFKAPRGCPSKGQWFGCAPRGNIVYINSRYEPGTTVRHDAAPLHSPWVDFFDTYSRRDWWKKWQPATYPPIFYRGDGPHNIGHKRGTNPSRKDLPHNRMDFVAEVVHEFGHWLGLGHPFYRPEDLIAWYGVPYPKGAVQPAKPHIIVVDTGMYKLFDSVEECGTGKNPHPPCYYYGGAECPLVADTTCPLPTPENPVEEWISDFKWSLLADKYSVMAYTFNKRDHPPGIPHPQTPANMRIIHPFDIRKVSDLNPSFAVSFPDISGVIRLTRKGEAYLTSNWLDACEKAELFKDHMSDAPFFITGVWSKTRVKMKIAAGSGHAVRIRKDGTLWCRGRNTHGELGTGNSADSNGKPVQEFHRHNDWISTAAGENHTLAIKKDGTLWSWGNNAHGQLGVGDRKNRRLPVQVGKDSDWFTAAGGKFHSVALKKNGTLWTWGRGKEYQLGIGKRKRQPEPFQLNQHTDWIAVSAGKFHTLALKADGTIWAWGRNKLGQCGNNTKEKYIRSPRRIIGNGSFAAIAAGDCHSTALKDNGSVWGWGCARHGELGNGDRKNNYTPARIIGAERVISLSAGTRNTLAVTGDGRVIGWGKNAGRGLGSANAAEKGTAVQLLKGDWTSAVTGKRFMMAVKSYHEEHFFQ